eukprot:UN20023
MFFLVKRSSIIVVRESIWVWRKGQIFLKNRFCIFMRDTYIFLSEN